MWQMWQMPRASGPPEVENFFQPVSSQVIRHKFCNNKKIKMGRIDIGNIDILEISRMVSKGPRANNCHGPRLALIRHSIVQKHIFSEAESSTVVG